MMVAITPRMQSAQKPIRPSEMESAGSVAWWRKSSAVASPNSRELPTVKVPPIGKICQWNAKR